LPDDDEDLFEQLEEPAQDALLVEALMGWDGDPCLCADCDCPRFRDGEPDGRCAPCRVGDHSAR